MVGDVETPEVEPGAYEVYDSEGHGAELLLLAPNDFSPRLGPWSETPKSEALEHRSSHLRLGVILLLLLIEGILVVQASRAAFSDTTINTTGSSSTVDLVDDDSGSAMFSVTNMVPGQSVTKCIVVTYQGKAANPAAVKLFSGGETNAGTLSSHINVTVEDGTGGSFSSCTGFTTEKTILNAVTLSTFNSTYNNYSTGAEAWDPSATPESKTYKVTVQLDPATPNVEQGKSISALVFIWEVQS